MNNELLKVDEYGTNKFVVILDLGKSYFKFVSAKRIFCLIVMKLSWGFNCMPFAIAHTKNPVEISGAIRLSIQ